MHNLQERLDSLRDEKLAAKAMGDTDGAVEDLLGILVPAEEAFEEMANGVTDPEKLGESLAELASEIADCYGIAGGTHWRMHQNGDSHLDEARDCYDRGATWETLGNYYYPNSYNLVNRIIIRILQQPDRFREHSEEIDKLVSMVRAQTHGGGRENQWWAWADLGLVALMKGDNLLADDAYQKFQSAGPKRRNYVSTIRVLGDLSAALRKPEPKISEALDDRSRRLKAAMPAA